MYIYVVVIATKIETFSLVHSSTYLLTLPQYIVREQIVEIWASVMTKYQKEKYMYVMVALQCECENIKLLY